MTRPAIAFALASLVLLLGAAAAVAAPARAYFGAHGAWGTYAMGDVNDELNAVSALIAPLRLDEINAGASFGAEVGIKLPRGNSFGLAWDHVTGSSTVADATGSLTYDVPANVFRFTGAHAFEGHGNVRPRLGGSFGVVSEHGSISLTAAGSGSASGDIRGSSAMAEIFGGVQVAAGPQADVTLDVGYRRAKAGGITVAGSAIQNASGDPYSVDFSGFLVRAGLRLTLAR